MKNSKLESEFAALFGRKAKETMRGNPCRLITVDCFFGRISVPRVYRFYYGVKAAVG
jgi:hypothetical protein